MDSFLGVPIRVRGEVFGNLYLCESPHGEFSAEAEALAVTAASRSRTPGSTTSPAAGRTGCAPRRRSVPLTGAPLRDSWPRPGPGLGTVVAAELALDPVLIVPLIGTRQVDGVLIAARVHDRPAFTDDDLDMCTGFANQASLALELACSRAEQQRAAVLDDRDRIAADLHDHVIQRLFVAGLSLQSVAKLLGPGSVPGDRIVGTIGDLDDTITQIRTTIFELQRVGAAPEDGLRGRVLDVVSDVGPALGFVPTTRFAGLLHTVVPRDVADDLVAVLREALSNVARHARAGSAQVHLAVYDVLTLDVVDDGVGVGGERRLATGPAALTSPCRARRDWRSTSTGSGSG